MVTLPEREHAGRRQIWLVTLLALILVRNCPAAFASRRALASSDDDDLLKTWKMEWEAQDNSHRGPTAHCAAISGGHPFGSGVTVQETKDAIASNSDSRVAIANFIRRHGTDMLRVLRETCSKTRAIVLGDSIMDDFTDNKDAWDKIADVFDGKVLNLAVRGIRTQLLPVYADWLFKNSCAEPQVVYLAAGVVSCVRDDPDDAELYAERIADTVRIIKHFSPATQVVVQLLLPTRNERVTRCVDNVNKILRKWLTRLPDNACVSRVDASEVVMDEHGELRRDSFTDKVHLEDDAIRDYGTVIARALRPYANHEVDASVRDASEASTDTGDSASEKIESRDEFRWLYSRWSSCETDVCGMMTRSAHCVRSSLDGMDAVGDEYCRSGVVQEMLERPCDLDFDLCGRRAAGTSELFRFDKRDAIQGGSIIPGKELLKTDDVAAFELENGSGDEPLTEGAAGVQPAVKETPVGKAVSPATEPTYNVGSQGSDVNVPIGTEKPIAMDDSATVIDSAIGVVEAETWAKPIVVDVENGSSLVDLEMAPSTEAPNAAEYSTNTEIVNGLFESGHKVFADVDVRLSDTPTELPIETRSAFSSVDEDADRFPFRVVGGGATVEGTQAALSDDADLHGKNYHARASPSTPADGATGDERLIVSVQQANDDMDTAENRATLGDGEHVVGEEDTIARVNTQSLFMPAIAGVAVGSAVATIFGAVALLVLITKRKRRARTSRDGAGLGEEEGDVVPELPPLVKVEAPPIVKGAAKKTMGVSSNVSGTGGQRLPRSPNHFISALRSSVAGVLRVPVPRSEQQPASKVPRKIGAHHPA